MRSTTPKQNTISTARNSNLELYRIIVMILIVAHHYVVNSGVMELMYEHPFSGNAIFLFLFGMWGKIGINCFVLITGYFMCERTISTRKFLKLILEVEFYNIVIYALFVGTGYETISISGIVKAILPITSIATNFTACFLVFYLCIPFLNVLISNINQKQHIKLLGLLGFIYIFMGTLPKFSVTMNYVSWFIVLYFSAAYIRLYPRNIFKKSKALAVSMGTACFMCIASVLCCVWLGARINRQIAYVFVVDSNQFLAVCMAVTSFLFFKNLNIKQSRIINTIASSTFGVLLIHANSDTMRAWLWNTVLDVPNRFSLSLGTLVFRSIVSVLGVFAVCVVIDQIRIRTIENVLLNFTEKAVAKVGAKIRNRLA